MNDPIDIKTKKSFIREELKKNFFSFSKDAIYDALEPTLAENIDIWGKFQQQWCNRAYNTFKDYDKYLILIYFVRQVWQSQSDRFDYYSMDEFYSLDNFVIEKINLIKISADLNIPKETIRRKVNELQKENILSREGKSIILNKSGLKFQKPDNTVETLSLFLHKKSKLLENNVWFGKALSKEEVKIFIEKYFTLIWLRFLKLQIPFLMRNRKLFKDLETWHVWGVIALNNQYMLIKKMKKNVISERVDYKNYVSALCNTKTDHGINGSSISDVSGIPRATVIRKMNWLKSMEIIKHNKKLEYALNSGGEKNIKIQENFIASQKDICTFVADVFDLMKNSKFKV
tara:strand:+ start:19 stop:1050 length:1032 start_codon:yes stop_codon:yes gene_type:complete